jgi:hypothetical protein
LVKEGKIVGSGYLDDALVRFPLMSSWVFFFLSNYPLLAGMEGGREGGRWRRRKGTSLEVKGSRDVGETLLLPLVW